MTKKKTKNKKKSYYLINDFILTKTKLKTR